MKTLFSLLLMLNSAMVFGAYPKPPEISFELDRSPYGQHVSLGTQLVNKKEHVLRAQWSQSASGSTTGSITLLDLDGKAAKLPVNSIVTDCLIHVVTPVTLSASHIASPTPYFAFRTGLDGSNDLKANTGAQTSAFSAAGLVACTPVGSAATSIRITTESTPVLVITSALHAPPYSTTTPSVATAGKINVLIKYILSE